MTPTPQPSEADQKAACNVYEHTSMTGDDIDYLAHAFAAVRAEEREACADVAVNTIIYSQQAGSWLAARVAKAIRARGEAKLDESTPKS